MNAIPFAWRSLRRQPARAALGILGVAAVGALLFDMLLLSNGLVLSMRDMLDRAGFDLRVTASDALPGQAPRLPQGLTTAQAIAKLPSVQAAMALRFADATLEVPGRAPLESGFQGVGGAGIRPWTVLRGRELAGTGEILINENVARTLGVEPGAAVRLRPTCSGDDSLPVQTLTVAGVAKLPFDTLTAATVIASMETMATACGGNDSGDADLIMVGSRPDEQGNAGSDAAARAIAAAVPELKVLTNEQLVGRLERGGFSYFRQISTVLTTVTLSFAVLLITVLLTVSVNQRLGDIAALRALGFSRGRVVADVLSESGLIVGIGGALSLPLGWGLAQVLDVILKRIPGLPAEAHFFVFEGQAVGLHVLLLAATAVAAALYPVWIVARLPIAATLRNEVVS